MKIAMQHFLLPSCWFMTPLELGLNQEALDLAVSFTLKLEKQLKQEAVGGQ